ncbi:hypothetical protein BH23CHL1_BH23CHL1_26860 [soil metagenome]|jgi:predicted molibdopterin-dependent oxidoreductase YjgC
MRTLQPDQIDRWLRNVSSALIDLCDLAPNWNDEAYVATKMSWGSEWLDYVHQFESLYRAYRAGGMNEDQQARFLTLQHDLEENASLVESLGLQRPPVLSKT